MKNGLILLIFVIFLVSGCEDVQNSPPGSKYLPRDRVGINISEYSVASGSYNTFYPDMYENTIVWSDGRNYPQNPLDWEIYMYYLGEDGIPSTGDLNEGEYQITNAPEFQGFWGISIQGNKIVWTDKRNGNNDIYMYNLGPDMVPNTGDLNEGEYQMTTNLFGQGYGGLSIYENKISWVDSRNQGQFPYDVYMAYFTMRCSSSMESYGECVVGNQPSYCSYYDKIIDNCQECGCPEGLSCYKQSGACVKKLEEEPNIAIVSSDFPPI